MLHLGAWPLPINLLSTASGAGSVSIHDASVTRRIRDRARDRALDRDPCWSIEQGRQAPCCGVTAVGGIWADPIGGVGSIKSARPKKKKNTSKAAARMLAHAHASSCDRQRHPNPPPPSNGWQLKPPWLTRVRAFCGLGFQFGGAVASANTLSSIDRFLPDHFPLRSIMIPRTHTHRQQPPSLSSEATDDAPRPPRA